MPALAKAALDSTTAASTMTCPTAHQQYRSLQGTCPAGHPNLTWQLPLQDAGTLAAASPALHACSVGHQRQAVAGALLGRFAAASPASPASPCRCSLWHLRPSLLHNTIQCLLMVVGLSFSSLPDQNRPLSWSGNPKNDRPPSICRRWMVLCGACPGLANWRTTGPQALATIAAARAWCLTAAH